MAEVGRAASLPNSLYDLLLFALCRVLSLSSWLFRYPPASLCHSG